MTYIETGGRLIEFTDSLLPDMGINGAMMAVDAKDIASKENYDRLDNSDMVVRPWKRDGDCFIIYYPENGTQRRFNGAEVKSILLDRPWINDGCGKSCSRPDPV